MSTEREWKIVEWQNQQVYCTVDMDLFRRYRDRRLLKRAFRAGKRYARLARKYA